VEKFEDTVEALLYFKSSLPTSICEMLDTRGSEGDDTGGIHAWWAGCVPVAGRKSPEIDVCVCAEEVDSVIPGCNCGERSGVFLPLAESGGFSRGLGVIPATATWRNDGTSCYVCIPCLPPGQGNRIAEW